jgi:hypothetical protein
MYPTVEETREAGKRSDECRARGGFKIVKLGNDYAYCPRGKYQEMIFTFVAEVWIYENEDWRRRM